MYYPQNEVMDKKRYDYRNIRLEELVRPERFYDGTEFLEEAVTYAAGKTMEVMPGFVHNYPSPCSFDMLYHKEKTPGEVMGSGWTEGFWTGMLWLSYELTGNELYRAVAEAQYEDYEQRYEKYYGLNHHDIGFLYIPSIVAQYKITGNTKAKKLGLKAAQLLSDRFCDKAGIIQVSNWDAQGNFIIDCSMNIPLLYWAAAETGERSFFYKAYSHISRTVECMLREDSSTYHCYHIDELTGEAGRGWQGQGYDDNSCWARGQAWLLYGLAISYRYTKDKSLLETAKRVANYFLNRLPDDLICNWDLIFTENEVQRDSSAASVAACGLLELEKYLETSDPYKNIYHNAAVSIMRNLAKQYTTKGIVSNGILQHGVYCKDKGSGGLGDDECCIWGDYFYMEGLIRLQKEWKMYW